MSFPLPPVAPMRRAMRLPSGADGGHGQLGGLRPARNDHVQDGPSAGQEPWPAVAALVARRIQMRQRGDRTACGAYAIERPGAEAVLDERNDVALAPGVPRH